MAFRLKMNSAFLEPRMGTAALAWFLSGTGGVAYGQGQEVGGLKRSYEEEIGKTVQPLREGYRKALLTLEQSLAAKGDYAGAIKVQEERRIVEKQLGRVSGGAAAGGAAVDGKGQVTLGSAGGEGSGGLHEEEGAWSGWQMAGGAVRWPLPARLKGGGYVVELVYRSTGAGTLPLTVREDFHKLSRALKVEPAAQTEGCVQLGMLRVRPGAAMLELKLTGGGTVADFRLLEVRMIPEGGE